MYAYIMYYICFFRQWRFTDWLTLSIQKNKAERTH